MKGRDEEEEEEEGENEGSRATKGKMKYEKQGDKLINNACKQYSYSRVFMIHHILPFQEA